MYRLLTRAARHLALGIALTAVAGLAACIEWDRSTSTELKDVRLYISGFQTTAGVQAVFHEGDPPESDGDAIPLTATLPPIVLKGGSAEVTFASTAPFSHIVLDVDGVEGYWDLPLGAPTQTATVLIIYAQVTGKPTFSLKFAGGVGDAVGQYSSSLTSFLGNGTGEVQVNITWNSKADVDLYVVDPFGDEIFYYQRLSNSGGELDIDSNAGCARDGPRAENVFWPFGVVPPHGEYVVRANYWSECGEVATDYVVTIRTRGGTPVIYRGHFTGQGVGGLFGAGKKVAAFTF